MTTRHIVAIGGAAFSGPLMIEYLLSLAEAEQPRICFVGTATGDSAAIIVSFYDAFTRTRARPSHVTLFGMPERDAVRAHLLQQDVIFVGGGNTANMLAVWRVHGVDAVLRDAWEAGIVLCGSSAGSVCWFEQAVTDSFGPQLGQMDGLGFLPGSNCPHYDSEPRRRPRYHDLIAGGMRPGYAADDGVGLHFEGTELTEVVSASPTGRGWRVDADGETELATRLLHA